MAPSQEDVTQLLINWKNGDKDALSQLTPIVYDELLRIANIFLRRNQNHSLQATMLVHEAYLRLAGSDQPNVDWQSRAHFLGIAARLMRCILIDYFRNRKASKRGGGKHNLSLSKVDEFIDQPEIDFIELNDALESLAKIDEQQSRIVELRFFGGLTIEETGEVLGISPSTIKREWIMARAWLRRALSKGADDDA